MIISIDRDLNASLNIRNIVLNTVGRTGINACGDGLLAARRDNGFYGLEM